MKTLELDKLHLAEGAHNTPDDGLCLLEAVAYVAGEKHSDTPKCASPTLGTFGRSLNDVLPDAKRQRLVPLVPKIVGTAGDGHDQERGLMAADWLIRVFTPRWLRLAGLTSQAEALESLSELSSWDDLDGASRVLLVAKKDASAAWSAAQDAAWSAAQDAARDAARDAAWSAAQAGAWYAARDAAWSAAWSAAWDAARDAARDAAQDAARAAAWYAARAAARAAARSAAQDAAQAGAWYAARAAARAAARDALQPTVVGLQDSAIELYGRMVRVGAK